MFGLIVKLSALTCYRTVYYIPKMSLLPLLSDLLEDYRRPSVSDLYDQHFGCGLLNDVSILPTTKLTVLPLRSGYLRPWRNMAAEKSGVSAIQNGKNELSISLDVQQFKPEELKVYVSDGYIVVEGKHEERQDDDGLVSRQFLRKYKLPKDVDEATLKSTFSNDGVLSLKASKKGMLERKGREIPITMTNEPAVKKKKSEQPEKMES